MPARPWVLPAAFNFIATLIAFGAAIGLTIHNYRWRQGLAAGEAKYDDFERQLASAPPITVPSITMEGDANGAFHVPPSTYAAKFTGRYEHRTITGGIGHNLPQEAPQAFAQAVIDVDRF